MKILMNIFLSATIFLISYDLFSQTIFNQEIVDRKEGTGFGLIDAVNIAFENNPKTQAIELKLKSAKLEIETMRAQLMFPSLNLSHSYVVTKNNSGPDTYRSHSNSSGIFLIWNIFNGFADALKIQEVQCRNRQLEAEYSSTNTQIRNTKGQLAGLVSDTYVIIARLIKNIEFFENRLKYFKALHSFAKTDEFKTRSQNAIRGLNIQINQYKSDLEIFKGNYLHLTKENLPLVFDDIDRTLQTLIVPATLEEAISIAEEKSPEIQTAKLALDCSTIAQKRGRAERNGIRVDISAGRSKYRSKGADAGQPYVHQRGFDNSVGVYISKSFDLGMRSSSENYDVKVEAAHRDLESARDDIANELFNDYARLSTMQTSRMGYDEQYKNSLVKLNEVMVALENGSSNEFNFAFDLLNATSSFYWSADQIKYEEISLRFRIQRNIGVLFDFISTQKLPTMLPER